MSVVACGDTNHESLVLGCLGEADLPYCDADLTALDYRSFLNECESLDFASVYAGLFRHGDVVELRSCLTTRPLAEDCAESFLRCAYGVL